MCVWCRLLLLASLAVSTGVVARAEATGEPVAPERFALAIPGAALTLEAVALPPGEYQVLQPGADAPVTAHLEPLWMTVTEVPWEAYDAFVYAADEPSDAEAAGVDALARPSKPYISYDRGWGHAGYPAIGISHKAAAAYCDWLSAHTGRTWRLPTPQEWQIACRAGAPPAGEPPDPAELADRAWFRANSNRRSHPVGTKEANAWGLHDLVGNAAEWAQAADGEFFLCGGSHKDRVGNLAPERRREPSPAWNASDPQLPRSPWWLADGDFVGFRIVSPRAADGVAAPDETPIEPPPPPTDPAAQDQTPTPERTDDQE